ncbi:MAG: hypothetical protein ACE37M_07635 [Henriciella sp.]
MSETLGSFTIDRRYCGPANSGNGGYVSGRMANFIQGPVRARITAPPPLETELTVIAEGEGVAVMIGDQKLASAVPSEVEIDLPDIPSVQGLEAAHAAYLEDAEDHPIAHCFVCGPKRDPGDALRLFTGPVPNSPVNADAWVPHADFAGEDGLIRSEILWSALDCPSAFSLRHGNTKLCLLGTLTAEIYRRPAPGEQLIVMAWPRGVEGRKNFADAAIVDADGDVLAAANAVWIELTDPNMIAAMKAGS